MGAVEIVARTVDNLQELEPQEIPELVADLEGIPGEAGAPPAGA